MDRSLYLLRFASLDVSIIKLCTTNFNIAFKPVSLPFHARRLRQRLKKARESNTKPVQRPSDLPARRNIKLLENKQLRLHSCSHSNFFPVSMRPSRNFHQWIPCSIGVFFSYVSSFCTFCFWFHCWTSPRSPAWAVEMEVKILIVVWQKHREGKGNLDLLFNNYYLFTVAPQHFYCTITTLHQR